MQETKGKLLNGWKEIAQYLGRGVRTVQRWESIYGMPVHRAANKDRSAVTAYSDDIDVWLKSASLRGVPYVRPTILVMEKPESEFLSNRKIELEIQKFNVLTAFTTEELRATAQRFDVDAFIVDLTLTDPKLVEVTTELKQRYPGKPVVVVGVDNEQVTADRFIEFSDVQGLKKTMIELLGEPKMVPAA
jgi:hypothetical protein